MNFGQIISVVKNVEVKCYLTYLWLIIFYQVGDKLSVLSVIFGVDTRKATEYLRNW